jgi:hypothetical protein
MKRSNLYLVSVPETKLSENENEEVSEKILDENFLGLVNDMCLQIKKSTPSLEHNM